MKILTPFFDAAGQHISFEITGGPRGWMAVIGDDLDSALHCKKQAQAIEGMINYTADMARGILTDHVISMAEKLVSQGLSGDDVLKQIADALAQETPDGG